MGCCNGEDVTSNNLHWVCVVGEAQGFLCCFLPLLECCVHLIFMSDDTEVREVFGIGWHQWGGTNK